MGNADSLGAEIFIDGKEKGTLANSIVSGLDSPCFWTKLPDGRHTLIVKKSGFHNYERNFQVITEAYVNVDLQPDKE